MKGKFGHQILTLNMYMHSREGAFAELERILEHEQPDVVGCGGISVAFRELDQLVPFIRERSQAKLVLGGGITSCESELVMAQCRPDTMVVGEGEFIFTQLLDAYLGNREIGSVKGLWYWRDEVPLGPVRAKSLPIWMTCLTRTWRSGGHLRPASRRHTIV